MNSAVANRRVFRHHLYINKETHTPSTHCQIHIIMIAAIIALLLSLGIISSPEEYENMSAEEQMEMNIIIEDMDL